MGSRFRVQLGSLRCSRWSSNNKRSETVKSLKKETNVYNEHLWIEKANNRMIGKIIEGRGMDFNISEAEVTIGGIKVLVPSDQDDGSVYRPRHHHVKLPPRSARVPPSPNLVRARR